MNIEYLIEKYGKLIYKICINMLVNPLDAEDTTQEVYINIYKSLDKYSSLPENEIKNIICKIALNKCKDILKSKSKKLENLTEHDDEKILNYKYETDIDYEIFKNEQRNYISKIINELKEPYSSILYDYYINENSLDNIAVQKNVSKDTLKVQMYRGKKLLKNLILNSGGDKYD